MVDNASARARHSTTVEPSMSIPGNMYFAARGTWCKAVMRALAASRAPLTSVDAADTRMNEKAIESAWRQSSRATFFVAGGLNSLY